MKLLSAPSQFLTNSPFDLPLSFSLSPSICALFNYVYPRGGRISQNVLGRWRIEIPPSSLSGNQTWIFQEIEQGKWLLMIEGVPQFFFSTEKVLGLLKNIK